MNLRQAAEQALKYLENNSPETDVLVQVEPHVWEYKRSLVIQALRQALAHPDLAEVGEVGVWGNKRDWVGMTDEEIQAERHKLDTTAGWTYNHFARAIEAKLKQKNESA